MMKKMIAAICCTLLITSISFAQDLTLVEAPAAEAVQSVVAEAAMMKTEAIPMATEAAPVVTEAAPITSSVVEGTVVNAPIASEYSVAPIHQGCGCCDTPVISQPIVSAPIVSAPIVSAPIVSAPVVSAPVVSAPVVSAPAPVVATPMATDCGCGAPAAPVAACDCGTSAPAAPTCCPTRERRQVIRGAISNMRSRRNSCCCN